MKNTNRSKKQESIPRIFKTSSQAYLFSSTITYILELIQSS